jgi:hypothetical protein
VAVSYVSVGDEEDDDDRDAVVPVPLDVIRVGGAGGASPTSITFGVSNAKAFDPNMIF